MNNVYIAGASGDIGSQFLKYSLDMHLKPYLFIHEKAYEKINEKLGIDIKENCDILFGEMFELKKLMQILSSSDAIVHLAAVLNTPRQTFEEKVETLCVNGFLTGLMVKLLKSCNSNIRLFYMSSEMVYQIAEDPAVSVWILNAKKLFDIFWEEIDIFKENNIKDKLYSLSGKLLTLNDGPPDVCFYSLTKLLGEKFISEADNAVTARLSNIYGPGYINDRKIPRLIKSKLLGNRLQEIDDTRDYVFVEDINNIIFSCIKGESKDITGIIDLMSGEKIKTSKVVKIIDKCLPIQYGDIILNNSKMTADARVPKTGTCNIFKLLRRKPVDFSYGMQKTVEYFQGAIDYSKKMKLGAKINDYVKNGESLTRIIHGGSSSFVLLIENSDKQKSIRKIALRDGVEGNGIPKLIKEIEFLEHIRNNEKMLSKVYSNMSNYSIDDNFAFYNMGYIGSGRNLFDCLCGELTVYEFFLHLNKLLNILVPFGYAKKLRLINGKESQNILDSLLLNRAMGRLHSLLNYKDMDYISLLSLLKRKSIVINGEAYINPINIIQGISSDRSLRALLWPRSKSVCVHGDLTFLNMVWDEKEETIRLIDPRGLIGMMDPLYDFGKMKFSLSGFSSIIRGRYELECSSGEDIFIRIIEEEAAKEKIDAVNNHYFEFLQNNDYFGILVGKEPYWRERILLYEAVHYLADIPFRLYTDGNPMNSIACFLFGTIYLNNLYKDISLCERITEKRA